MVTVWPQEIMQLLTHASRRTRTASTKKFTCEVFDSPWNQFVEEWAPRIYTFLGQALGPYNEEPLPEILQLPDGMHSAGATASYTPGSGQIHVCASVENKPGQTLEKLTHEMTHASLAHFPDGDPFYEESQVDYSVWVMAHAPVWGQYRDDMIKAAAFNIRMRRERALKTHTDYDCKRWAGGVFAMMAYGPLIVARLRQKKMTQDYTW